MEVQGFTSSNKTMKTLKFLSIGFAVLALACLGVYGAGTTVNGARTIAGNLIIQGTCTGCGGGVTSVNGKSGAVTGTGSALVLLETHPASTSVTLPFTTCINSSNAATYTDFVIRIQNLVPTTAADSIILQVSTDGGATYVTSSTYSWINSRFVPGSGANAGGTGKAYILLDGDGLAAGLATDAHWGLVGNYTLTNPASTSVYKQVHSDVTQFLENGGARVGGLVTGAYEATTAITAFRISASDVTHSLASGTVSCYGVATS